MPELTDEQVAHLRELLKDAESCVRLSQYEEEFLGSIRDRFLVYEARTRISDAQWRVLRCIEEKIYA